MPKTIRGIKKKHFSGGKKAKFKRECRQYLEKKFEHNWKKRRKYWDKYDDDNLKLEDVQDILSEIDKYELKREYDKDKKEYLSKIKQNRFSKSDLNQLLTLAYTDAVTKEEIITKKRNPGHPELDKKYVESVLRDYRKCLKTIWDKYWKSDKASDFREKHNLKPEGENDLTIEDKRVLWQRCLNFCVEYKVYPLYHRKNGWYTLLPFEEYLQKVLDTERKRIAGMIKSSVKTVKSLDKKFSIIHKLPSYDGDFKELDNPLEKLKLSGEKLRCPKCGRKFKYATAYEKHVKKCEWD